MSAAAAASDSFSISPQPPPGCFVPRCRGARQSMGACANHYQFIHSALERGDSREQIAVWLGMTTEALEKGYVRYRSRWEGEICLGSSCEDEVSSRGFCVKHYQSIKRLLRLGYSLEVIARRTDVSVEAILQGFDVPEDYPVEGGPEILDQRIARTKVVGPCYIPECETQEVIAGACQKHYQAMRRWISLRIPLVVIAERYAMTVEQLLEHLNVPPDYPRERAPDAPGGGTEPETDPASAQDEDRVSPKMRGGVPVAVAYHYGRVGEGVRWVSYRRPFDPEDHPVRRRSRKTLPDPWYLAANDGKW